MVLRLNGKEVVIPEQLHQVEDAALRDFLYEWTNEQPDVEGHTSGSTGVPKEIRLRKEDMQASARITNEFFGIGQASVLLLCLSVSYIAGKMMVVRALEAGAELWCVQVSSHPLRELRNSGFYLAGGAEKKIDLAAMVPLQAEETLKVAEEKKEFICVRQLLIGGAPVSSRLEQQLQLLPVHCYATYGMTETVSHVALRRMDGRSEYDALGEVSFSSDCRGCLVIHAPHLTGRKFVTNDMVELKDERHFRWLGRYDHVINSGGIKFFPEVIEGKIASCFSCRYFITSLPDERLGERIVLVIEGKPQEDESLLMKKLKLFLVAYEMPKEILYLPHFRETFSGKIIRKII